MNNLMTSNAKRNGDVSIVLISWSPTDKRLALLQRSFASLKDRTQYPHILVVVDNGPNMQTEWLKEQKIDIRLVNEVNVGVGRARNLGASQTKTEFIAFVDSDIEYFDGWLESAIQALKKYPEGKFVAAPAWSGPVRLPKHRVGCLDEYDLYNRASGQCLIMRRSDYEVLGRWSATSVPGNDFCYAAREAGYKFIRHPLWCTKHLCKYKSYDYRDKLVNGEWVPPTEKGEVTI